MAHPIEKRLMLPDLLRCRVPLSALALLLASTGCGNYAPEAHRVDADVARATLQSVLSSWQQGETPASWQNRDPGVIVQDVDWITGMTLVSFEIAEDCRAVDANLRCRVMLTLEDSQGKALERSVTYLVGTSPQLTVFRAVE